MKKSRTTIFPFKSLFSESGAELYQANAIGQLSKSGNTIAGSFRIDDKSRGEGEEGKNLFNFLLAEEDVSLDAGLGVLIMGRQIRHP